MQSEQTKVESSRFRLDVATHEILTGGQKRPSSVFPRFPEKAGDVEPDAKYLPKKGDPYRPRVTAAMVRRGLRGWLYPYVRSRVMPGDYHPIIAYLFTEWKCNLDCHYCWAFDNSVKGMTEDTARRPCFPMYSASYDWGVAGNHRFEAKQLDEMKRTCQTHCFSTLNHNLAYCYKASRAIKWTLKQALNRFQGTTGGFED